MNGCFLQDTPIAVDIWRRPTHDETKLYFLTHLHLDHIKGLTSSWRFPFYTSPINCSLLKEMFEFKPGIVIPLELDESHLVPIDDRGNTMSVTLIDANHVPGAVMFLFEGPFGSILYTGDTRFYPEVLEHPALRHAISAGGVDRLYLDNTFCHPGYDFPSRQQATRTVFEIIEKHPDHVIKLGIRSLGKEDLLEAVSQKFQEVIFVNGKKYKQLQTLKRPNLYTTKFLESRIHAIIINRIHARNHEKWNLHQPTISILLTALYHGVPPHQRAMANVDGVFVVPYSDHSSWGELNTFVRAVKPRKVLPIVKHEDKRKDTISLALKGRDDMRVFEDVLLEAGSGGEERSVVKEAGLGGGEERSVVKECYLDIEESRSVEEFCAPIPVRSMVSKRRKVLRRRAMSKGVQFTPQSSDEETGQDWKSSKRKDEGGSPLRLNSVQEEAINSPLRPHSTARDFGHEQVNTKVQSPTKLTCNSNEPVSYANERVSEPLRPTSIPTEVDNPARSNESNFYFRCLPFTLTQPDSNLLTCPMSSSPLKHLNVIQCPLVSSPPKHSRTLARDYIMHSPHDFTSDKNHNLVLDAVLETKSLLNQMLTEPHLDVQHILDKGVLVTSSLQKVNDML